MSYLLLDAAAATSLVISEGNGQSGPPSTRLPIDPQVLALDANGLPVQGVSVTFAIASGGGSLVGAAVQTTNASGLAAIGWVLGASLGVDTLTATVGGLSGSPLTFTANDVLSVSGWTAEASWAAPCTVG